MALLFFSLLYLLCSHAAPASPLPGRTAADELALLSFKSMLSAGTSDSEGLLASWNTSSHHCSWPGVVCGGRRHPERVVALRLGSSNLSGRISLSLGNLSFLRELDLGDNRLIGKIPPELGRLSKLRLLNLSSNSLHGGIPPALGNLTHLWYLVLAVNSLSGAIPSSLGQLTSLSRLSVAVNNLTGVIPTSIWNISSLELFSVKSNKLGGEIPPNAFSALPLLHRIYMDENQFHGSLPVSLVNASNVSLIQLRNNLFSGVVPPEIGRLKNLNWLLLGGNLFEAKEPKDWEFITALTNCSKLRTSDLSGNKFGGVLPDSLSNLSTSLEYLDLSSNTIKGSIPNDIGNLIGLRQLYLSDNSFTGSLPA